MPVFASVSPALDDLFEISVYGVLLQGAVQAAQEREEMTEGHSVFMTQMAGALEPLLQHVEAACGEVLYPFDSATGEITLSQYLFGRDLPDEPTHQRAGPRAAIDGRAARPAGPSPRPLRADGAKAAA